MDTEKLVLKKRQGNQILGDEVSEYLGGHYFRFE